jgi:hypothetical protein
MAAHTFDDIGPSSDAAVDVHFEILVCEQLRALLTELDQSGQGRRRELQLSSAMAL